jgi:hypothetical protein
VVSQAATISDRAVIDAEIKIASEIAVGAVRLERWKLGLEFMELSG